MVSIPGSVRLGKNLGASYMGTSLIRKSAPLGPYSRTIPEAAMVMSSLMRMRGTGLSDPRGTA